MKKIKWLFTLSLASLALMAFSEDFQDEWVVPEEYVNMKNPTDPSQDLNIGKVLYRKHCQSCHGKEG